MIGRHMRQITPPHKYGHENLASYAFTLIARGNWNLMDTITFDEFTYIMGCHRHRRD